MTTDTRRKLEILCDAELHNEHLCYIVSQGLHLSDALAYEALIDEPRFRCGHCGRHARSHRTLKYNKFCIGLSDTGSTNNFAIFRPKKSNIRVEVRVKKDEDLKTQIELESARTAGL